MVDFYSLNTDTGEIGKKAYRVAGENATWNLYNGVLTISGTGALAINSEGKHRSPVSSASSWLSYSGSDNAWKSIRKYVKKIVVEEGITSIPDSAFTYFDNLEEVKIKLKKELVNNYCLLAARHFMNVGTWTRLQFHPV